MTWSTRLLAASLILLPIPAAAAGAGITYDCDTAAGHFSELNLPAPTPRFRVSGKVQLNALAESKDYGPIARIHVASPAGPGQLPELYAGFSFSALPVDGKRARSGARAIQMLGYNVNGKEDEVLSSSVLTTLAGVQPFTLSYDGSAVSVTLGTETKSFPMKIAEPSVRIICSTGEFLFTDLTISPQG